MQIKIANLFPFSFLSFPLRSFVSPLLAVNVFYRAKYPRPAARRFGDRSRRRFSFFAATCTCSATEPTGTIGNSALYILCSYRPCRIKQQLNVTLPIASTALIYY
ncbi:hypothetical protein J3E68DRAFT_402051 [Trichoderma sp. SZMC 28012]